jgi:succinate dehydrogenase / fumarate reductase cytochrome b subunit
MVNLVRHLFCSSLGKKYLMAGSGAVLVLFVLGHLAGNLQIFLGPEAINRYGHFLQSNVELLWPVRIALLAIIAIHIWSASKLTLENRAARPAAYEQLHFTVMVKAVNLTGKDFDAKPEFFDAQGRHDVYKMMVSGFQQPLVSAFYLIGVGLLCLHLSHGLSAMFQSLGWKKHSYGECLDRGAKWVAALIFLGYSSIPVTILLGCIK